MAPGWRPALRVYKTQPKSSIKATKLEVVSSALEAIAPGLRPALLVHETQAQKLKTHQAARLEVSISSLEAVAPSWEASITSW